MEELPSPGLPALQCLPCSGGGDAAGAKPCEEHPVPFPMVLAVIFPVARGQAVAPTESSETVAPRRTREEGVGVARLADRVDEPALLAETAPPALF